jgi:hypothetical protein
MLSQETFGMPRSSTADYVFSARHTETGSEKKAISAYIPPPQTHTDTDTDARSTERICLALTGISYGLSR